MGGCDFAAHEVLHHGEYIHCQAAAIHRVLLLTLVCLRVLFNSLAAVTYGRSPARCSCGVHKAIHRCSSQGCYGGYVAQIADSTANLNVKSINIPTQSDPIRIHLEDKMTGCDPVGSDWTRLDCILNGFCKDFAT